MRFLTILILITIPILLFGKQTINEKVDELAVSLMEKASEEMNTNEMVLAVTPLVNESDEAEEEKIGESVSEFLGDRFINYGINIVEREQLETLLDEMELALSGVVDNDQAVEIGEMAGASVVLIGSVNRLGENFNIVARLVDVETSEVIVSSTLSIPMEQLISVVQGRTSEEKYAVNAMFRSMLVPGWGQFYSDRPVMGAFISGTELILLGGGITMAILANSDYEKYSISQPEMVYYYDQAVLKRKIGNILLWSAIGVYAYNVLDALIFGPREEEAEVAEVIRFDEDGVNIALFHYQW